MKRGQSLVETAIIAPLLIFLFIGVFEVGYVIRNYIVLLDISREAARFAARPRYLDFDRPAPGYEKVIEHAVNVSDGIDARRIKGIIISFIGVSPVLPCDPAEREEPQGGDYWPNCDCDQAVTAPFSVTVRTPLDNPVLGFRWPETSTLQTKLDYVEMAEFQQESHARIICEQYKKLPSVVPLPNNSITVEIFYEHRQLFGFPFISNSFTDPMILHTQSTFRHLSIQRREN